MTPASHPGCSPRIDAATAVEFEMVNPLKVSNFILGSVAGVELTFVVENLPKTTPTSGCPGWWLFQRMMAHFESAGASIAAIVGSWTYGDNLAKINRLTTGSNPLSLEGAASVTTTGGYAAAHGYTRVSVDSFTGTAGAFSRVRVMFRKEE